MLVERMTSDVNKRTSLVPATGRSQGALLPKTTTYSMEGTTAINSVLPPKGLSKPDPTSHASIERGPAELVESLALSKGVVLQQLARLLRSKPFVQSDKLSRFLRFVVEHVVDRNDGCLKEYLIGVEVYDRKPPYDPSQDSIVRTEARRLRGKLKEYYESEGKNDPIYIYMRPGSYVPVLQSRDNLAGTPALTQQALFYTGASSPVVIMILPFRDVSQSEISAAYARGIPDELAYALMLSERFSVIGPPSFQSPYVPEHDTASAMRSVGAQLAFEGSAKVDGRQLRITARVVDAAGAQHWLKRIDVELGVAASFTIEEEIASALSFGLFALFDRSQTPSAECRLPACPDDADTRRSLGPD